MGKQQASNHLGRNQKKFSQPSRRKEYGYVTVLQETRGMHLRMWTNDSLEFGFVYLLNVDSSTILKNLRPEGKVYNQQENAQMTKNFVSKLSKDWILLGQYVNQGPKLLAYAMFLQLWPYLWAPTTFPLFPSSSKGPKRWEPYFLPTKQKYQVRKHYSSTMTNEISPCVPLQLSKSKTNGELESKLMEELTERKKAKCVGSCMLE
ncbi:unnamed protein product [Dovyalis caffra]|uniref:Uncharacterized protein n=1 Tax=Dovyalis caffra TaxID=77055 RepID=A0AAV1RPY5_9ROSI|nr:unnamed protein product [Dovyalis caffra]